jgi:hypothetical protein
MENLIASGENHFENWMEDAKDFTIMDFIWMARYDQDCAYFLHYSRHGRAK